MQLSRAKFHCESNQSELEFRHCPNLVDDVLVPNRSVNSFGIFAIEKKKRI